VTRASGTEPVSAVMAGVVAAAALAVVGCLIWGLRSLILPASVGGLLAYVCRPIVDRLERYGIQRGLAVGVLLLVLGAVALASLSSIRAVMPSQIEALELRVRVLYSLNHRYQSLMGLDPSWTRGNRLYQLLSRDLDPLLDRVSEVLALTGEERAQLAASREQGAGGGPAPADRLLAYERANAQTLQLRARRAGAAGQATGGPSEPARGFVPTMAPGAVGVLLSTWMIAPLIFLFLLWDTGNIKRGLLRAVPNRLFEPALAVLADVDQALGDYLRGIVRECCALGATVFVLLLVVGVPPHWALAIGTFTGLSNLLPYMGFVAALVSGLAYSLLAKDVNSLIPFVTDENFPIWVVAAVLLAELLKNVVYEPVVLGSAVKLHPLAVVVGALGGATLFGPAGMFLAIPVITVVKVLVASTARHLSVYGLV